MKIKVGVIFGGNSVEHEVSVISGIQALSWFDRNKYEPIPIYLTKNNQFYIGEDIGNIKAYKNLNMLLKKSKRVIPINENNEVVLLDYPLRKIRKNKTNIHVLFPVLHGLNAEDGTIQGYLKMLGVPFVGSDVCASSVGMNKYFAKNIVRLNDIPVLDGLLFHFDSFELNQMVKKVENSFDYPVIIKPNDLGSSIGVCIANNRDELSNGIRDAFMFTKQILVEPAVTNLREINCAVLGDTSEAIASECEEPVVEGILSYEDKYVNSSKTKGMASASRIIPPHIPESKLECIKQLAVKSFNTLNCCGVARIDFILDENLNIYFNEINTIPGSLSFYLWKPAGINEKELTDRLIQLALRRWQLEHGLHKQFETNILKTACINGTKC